MVASTIVKNDLSDIKNIISTYKSSIEQLDASWKGLSHDNIDSEANNFSDDYLTVLQEQANSFAEAIRLYEEFINQKNSYNAQVDEYNTQISNGAGGSYATTVQRQLEIKEKEVRSIETQVREELNKVMSKKLEASKINISISKDFTNMQSSNSVSTTTEEKTDGSLTKEQLNSVMDAANSQIGVPYSSMHYGPAGSGDEGFGCAMFVSYCYNQALFDGVSADDTNTSGFYGSTWEYWGNVTNDGYDAHNKGFVEVSEEEAQPGDVVAYTVGDGYDSATSCGHVALYTGNGRIIGAEYSGVKETSVEAQADGRTIHYLHYVGNQTE